MQRTVLGPVPRMRVSATETGRAALASPSERVQLRAGVYTWSLDLRTGALVTNASTRALLGWSSPRAAATPDDLVQGVHPEDRDDARACFAALVADGTDFTLEHRSLLPDGSVLHLRSSACAELDAGGRVVAVHGVSTDVTALRHAAQELELERQRGHEVLAAMSEGYLLLRRGLIVEANAAFCAMTGFPERELVGAGPPYPFWAPEDVTELDTTRLQAAAAGGGTGEFDVQRKDGTRRRVEVTASRLASASDPSLWLALVRDVTEQRAHESALAAQAAADPLTGVQNSRTFRQQLHEAVRQAGGGPLSLALIDVDHFKQVNDTFGHAVGDEVLVAVVERLVAATAGSGVLARVGGEEFGLLMPGLDAAQAHRVLERALVELAASPIGVAGTITASAGVAQLREPMTDDALYRLADGLLYEAKARGRNQVR